MKCTEHTPKVIVVDFNHYKEPYYLLETEDLAESMPSYGILNTLEGLEKRALLDITISYWSRTSLGLARTWSCDGEYFMSHYKLDK